MNSKQKGFTALHVLLLLIIVGIIGFTGWYVWHAKNSAEAAYSSTPSSAIAKSRANDPGQETKHDKPDQQPEAKKFSLLSGKVTFADTGAWKLASGGYHDKDRPNGSCRLTVQHAEPCTDEIMLIPVEDTFTNPDQFNVEIRVFPKNGNSVNDIARIYFGEVKVADDSPVGRFTALKAVVAYENERRIMYAIDIGENSIVVVTSRVFKGNYYSYKSDKDYFAFEPKIHDLVKTIDFKSN